jgi:GT2 family glycosyltransferase
MKPPISQPSVSIVIPSWNGRFLLEEMFPSLLSATNEFEKRMGGTWEIIVVDDGSVDDTIPWIESNPEKRIKLITRRRNSGFSFACNLGFSACRYSVVILLNNDVIVHRDFLLPVLKHFEDDTVFGVTFKALSRDKGSFCNGGKIGEFRMGFWKAYKNYDVAEDVGPTASKGELLYSFSVCGGFCAFSRQKLQEIGGFETLLSPFYWEDVELSYRAWKRGWKVLYEPMSIVYHDASTTIRGAFNRIRVSRINHRNRFIFIWKNLHSHGMMFWHLCSMLLLIIQGILTFRIAFFLGLGDAVGRLSSILTRRWDERRHIKVEDREIQRLFNEFRKKSFVQLK